MTRNSKLYRWIIDILLSAVVGRRERDWVLGEFKAGRSPILIATDVASRGLGTYYDFIHSSLPPRATSKTCLCQRADQLQRTRRLPHLSKQSPGLRTPRGKE